MSTGLDGYFALDKPIYNMDGLKRDLQAIMDALREVRKPKPRGMLGRWRQRIQDVLAQIERGEAIGVSEKELEHGH